MSALQRAATAGVAWTATAHLAGQTVQLAAGVVLARLLAPTDFGTAGLALTIAGIIATVNQLGLFASIVQRRELTASHYNTALVVSAGSGLLFGGALLLAAAPIAAAFRNPGLGPVLRLYPLLLIAGGLSAVQSGLLCREFRFKQLALATLAGRVLGGAVAIALALGGLGVMSIAWGYVVQLGLLALLLSVAAFRLRRPALRLSARAFCDLFRYGFGVMGANLLNQLSTGLDLILVGRLIGPLGLGHYALAAQNAAYIPRALNAILPQVAFPALTRVQDQLPSLRAAHLRLTRACALLAVPPLALLAAAAPDLVPAVFGPQWTPSILPLQLLALAGMVSVLDWTWSETLKARGKSLQVLLMTAGSLLLLGASAWAGSRLGITGIAAGLLCSRLAIWLSYQTLLNRTIGSRMTAYLAALRAPLAVAAATGTAAAAARALAARLATDNHWLGLGISAIAAAAAYGIAVRIFARAAAGELLELASTLPRARWAAMLISRLCGIGQRAARVSAGPRVCLMTSVHPATDVRIHQKEAVTLARAGYQVILIAPAWSCGSHEAKDGTGIEVRPVRIPRNRLLRMTVGTVLMLTAALRQQAAAYHIHDPELLPAAALLKLLGRRVVYDVHEDYSRQLLTKHYLPAALRRTLARLAGGAEKAVAAKLDAVVAATDTIGARLGAPTTVVVRNYPKAADFAPRYRHDGGPFRLAHFSGTLTPERGISNNITAMAELGPGYQLILGGRFVTPAYERQTRTLPGFQHVRFLGPVPHAAVLQQLRACDAGIICLLPLQHYRTSLPVKLFEFMAAGLPVIASDFPLFRDIVESSGCGLVVDPTNPKAIADAIARLAADPVSARRMGNAGRAAVLSRWNWESEAAALVELYKRLCAGRAMRDGGLLPAIEGRSG